MLKMLDLAISAGLLPPTNSPFFGPRLVMILGFSAITLIAATKVIFLYYTRRNKKRRKAEKKKNRLAEQQQLLSTTELTMQNNREMAEMQEKINSLSARVAAAEMAQSSSEIERQFLN